MAAAIRRDAHSIVSNSLKRVPQQDLSPYMESTGVYWIPVSEILEARGIRPCVVDARHMKNVPGRRADWHECQWIQFLHSVGLLRPAFRPEAQVCALPIMDAILAGERDPVEPAKLRNPHIKARPEIIEKSLVGNWQPEHLFTLKQSRRLYAEYQQQLAECDAEIERLVGQFAPRVDPEVPCPRTARRTGTVPRRERSAPRRSRALGNSICAPR